MQNSSKKILLNLFLILNIFTYFSYSSNADTFVYSGGCFWCTEAIYKRLNGVLGVKPGFSGGNIKNPSYKEVCTGRTGHAETVEVVYDSSQIDFQLLLEVFFKTHDPTTINRQGNDIGTHYRSIVFYSNSKERELVTNYIDFLNNKIYDNKIVTEIVEFDKFYEAESYHENYYELNKTQPYCDFVITPKVEKFEKNFKNKLIKD